MQTITTTYLGPTNHLGSRYKATHTGKAKTVTLSADYALSAAENHALAAKTLANKLRWEGSYVGGHVKDGMVFVNADPMYGFEVSI